MAQVSALGGRWKFHSNFFATAVKSCQQLLTADKNENQPTELKFGTGISFGVYMKIPFIFFRDSCHQLSTTDNSCWQLMKLKIKLESWNLAQISALRGRWKCHLIFFCYSCHQLSTSDNSCWQLMKMKIKLESWNSAQVSTLVCT